MGAGGERPPAGRAGRDVAGPGGPAGERWGTRLALSPDRPELGEARSLCGPQCSRLGWRWAASQERELFRSTLVPGPQLQGL